MDKEGGPQEVCAEAPEKVQGARPFQPMPESHRGHPPFFPKCYVSFIFRAKLKAKPRPNSSAGTAHPVMKRMAKIICHQ